MPFAARTETVLRRAGLCDDAVRFNSLTVAEVDGWWNTGTGTIADLRTTAHPGIRDHHQNQPLRARIDQTLGGGAAEPWARTVWRHDPRFSQHLPRIDATAYTIATTGTALDRRFLYGHVGPLRTAITAQGTLTLTTAVVRYIELITGQHDERLDALLARTGLNGHDPISAPETGRRLGVTYQPIHQLEKQFQSHRNRTATPAGIWMPQVDEAIRGGWPDAYTNTGIDAITAFVAPHAQ